MGIGFDAQGAMKLGEKTQLPATRLSRSSTRRGSPRPTMSSLFLVRNQSVVDDADEHQEPKQDDEDREHPAFGQTVAPQFLNNNLRIAVGLSRCGQREEARTPSSSASATAS
jgi:hypothetical protein